ncbi:MAG: PqqD family protein [Gemmatimonadales bacterium]|nr:MAG: PqqD family protein [Gemmatimonadales bacterium]
MDTRRYYQLNETAAVIWAVLQTTGERATALAELQRSFEVDEETAARELDRVLVDLLERQLIVPQNESA